MKTISVSEKNIFESYFSESIYRNEHPGWLDLWELTGPSGSIFFGDRDNTKALLGFQYTASKSVWLHSMVFDQHPKDFDLAEAIRSCFFEKNTTVYAISFHSWCSELLRKNYFRKCDEINEYETDQISSPVNYAEYPVQELCTESINAVLGDCETAFPPLWRLELPELHKAVLDAQYRICIKHNNSILGYLLADLSDNNCHILRLAVNTLFQNNGIASALIHETILYCRQRHIHNFSVNTNKLNLAANNYYRSLNFNLCGSVFPVYFRTL